MTYEVIKHNYDRGLWSDVMVRMCVRKGIITEEQYEAIINGANEQATE
jgi:hypothetical protein